MRWLAIAITGSLAALSCRGGDGTGRTATTRQQAAVDTVAMAAERYDPAMFDSISWKKPNDAFERGGVVWVYSCQKCHGNSGAGDAGFVLRGDTLRPPSFLAADWHLANQPDSIRRTIFTGNTKGMPHWGLIGLKLRDIDAVTRYILEVLRAPQKR